MGRTYCGNNYGNYMIPKLHWQVEVKASTCWKKLSKEHLDLTSYSRTRVNLAVEVCIHSISLSGVRTLGVEWYSGTEVCQEVWHFFDCVNVRHPSEHIRHCKPNLEPYTNKDDERFAVCSCMHDIMHSHNYHTMCHSGWRMISLGTWRSGRKVWNPERMLLRVRRLERCWVVRP